MTAAIAFIQARMSSSRFPGKVIEPLGGVPSIAYMVQRVRRAKTLDDVVVVTSTDSSDDPMVQALSRQGIPYFRGHLQDVLTRYVDAAAAHGATEIVRLTGDCPLMDPAVIDAVVNLRRGAEADYASNIDPPTFPDGLDVETFTADVLMRAHQQARLAPEREHVTLWMRTAAAGLRRANCTAPADLSSLRVTVDYPDDLAAVRAAVADLHATCGEFFDLFDLLRCLWRRPDIVSMNKHQRNEGLAASLAAPTRAAGDGRSENSDGAKS